MKKVKLFATIASLCLAVAVLCFGVFSATQISYTIGGTISYEVKDAFVKVNTKVYKGTNAYNRGELELVSEDFASGTKTLASENFTQDTSYVISEYDSTSASTFVKNDMNFEFSSTTKSYVVEMDIKNLSPSVSVWAIAEWNIDDNSNIVQGNNVMQKEITSTASKKIYFAVSVEDFRNSISGVNYSMNLKIGVGDYSRSEENLSKITIDSEKKVTPKDNISGLVVIPEDCIVEPATYTEIMEQQVPISPFATSGADTIVLPSTVESCLKMCVIGCQNVTRIVGVQTFGSDQMFYGQTGIFSARAKNLDGYTYAMCSNLQAVDFGNCISTGDYTFFQCTNLKSVGFGNLTTIGQYAFCSCGFSGELIIPGNVKTIGRSAFLANEKITSLKFEDGVGTLELDAFDESYGLENIYFAKSVTFSKSPFGTSFNEMGKDVNVYVEDLEYLFKLSLFNNIGWIGNGYFNYYVNNVLTKDIIIPSTMTKINNCAFVSANIESITIPNSITEIGNYTFYNCQRLKTINYLGTKAQWDAITKGTSWNGNCPSDMIIKCTDGNV